MPSDASSDLNAAPSEAVKVADIGSPSKPLHGLVAVLDALGASAYSRDEVEQFLESRDQVIALVASLAQENLKIDAKDLRRFIFNDTVVLAYVRGVTLQDVENFCHVLRAFEVFFINKHIFFRGAFAIGEFYRVDEATNTIMGPSVSDAAAWFARADWIGIHATPHATVVVMSLLGSNRGGLDHVLVDYEVPLKDKLKINLKAINWPKGLYFPLKDAETSRAVLLSRLAKRQVPMGSESKYFHTIEFYDHVEKSQRFGEARPGA